MFSRPACNRFSQRLPPMMLILPQKKRIGIFIPCLPSPAACGGANHGLPGEVIPCCPPPSHHYPSYCRLRIHPPHDATRGCFPGNAPGSQAACCANRRFPHCADRCLPHCAHRCFPGNAPVIPGSPLRQPELFSLWRPVYPRFVLCPELPDSRTITRQLPRNVCISYNDLIVYSLYFFPHGFSPQFFTSCKRVRSRAGQSS